MRQDLISVIVPVYNVDKYLDKCIESIVNQTYKNIEIILVDDGSTDLSGVKCDIWGRRDNRVKVIHQTHQGPSVARNKGLQLSTGEYIQFVDSDDYIDSTMCETLSMIADKEKADVVACTFYNVDGENNTPKTIPWENKNIYGGG